MRPLILISNDDGYQAEGVHRLIDFLGPVADIVAVCPDGPRSGQSMAISVDNALRLTALPDYNGAKMYKVNGTPVDCVKLAIHHALDRLPSLVVAGINHGSNASINVLYSGTMGAAFEGCAFGIPSIGFSLTDHHHDADFTPCERFVTTIVKKVLAEGLPNGVALNVNIPKDLNDDPKIRVVNECRGNWSDEYKEYTDPHGHKFYLLTGVFINEEPENPDTDEYALSHGDVSVVPVGLWRHTAIPDLRF